MNWHCGYRYLSLAIRPSSLGPLSGSSIMCTSSITTVPTPPSLLAPPDLSRWSIPSYVPTMISESMEVRIFPCFPFPFPFQMRLFKTFRAVVRPSVEYLFVNWSYFWLASATNGTRKSIFPLPARMLLIPPISPMSVLPVAVTDTTSWFFLSSSPDPIEIDWTGRSVLGRILFSRLSSFRSCTLTRVTLPLARTRSNNVSSRSIFLGSSKTSIRSRSRVLSSCANNLSILSSAILLLHNCISL